MTRSSLTSMSALLVRFLLIAQMTLGRDLGSKYAVLPAETKCGKKKRKQMKQMNCLVSGYTEHSFY